MPEVDEMSSRQWVGAAVMLLALVWPASALAQFETAAVVGVVLDKQGAAVPGAKVTLTNSATGVSVASTTDATGSYEFITVRIGAYVVTAEKAGFSLALADNVQVSVGSRRRVDLTLEVGGVTETVQVTAGTDMLDTDTSQRGQTVRGEDLRRLPVLNREYSSLALLSAGVRPSALASSREGSFNVNGLRSTFNNFLIDGVDNNAYGTSNQGFSNQVMQPAPEAVGEFQVVTNNMSAEYGRAAGATVNVAYRSGTNRFSTSLWEFFRDSSLTSEGYFKPAAGQEPKFDRHQFGGVLGGPIRRNRAFFFGDIERLQQDRTTVATSTIATAQQRQGILSVAVRNPQTGVTYAAGTPIPMTTFAQKVLNDLPAPTTTGTANNYVRLVTQQTRTTKAGGKVDVVFSPQVTAFARFGWREAQILDEPGIPTPSGGDGNGETYARNLQLALGTTWMPDSSSLLEMRFGWSKTEGGKNPPALGSAGALETYGISGLPTDPRVAGGLPSQLITGYTTLGRQATNPQWQWPTVFNPKVNYTRAMGRHSFKAGFEFQHIQTQVQDVNPLYGRDQYAGQFTRPTGTSSNNLYNLADFMFGLRSTFALSNILVADLRQNMTFLYVQDDWRVNDRLTLNLGLRYEYATPQWEKDNVLSNFDPQGLRMVLAKDGSVKDRSTINPDRNNLGPRLGFAYTLTPRTVVRGGYGMSYVHFHRAGGANILPINGPQVINAVVVQTNPTDPAFRTTQAGYPEGLTDPSRFNPLTANITYMPDDYRSSRVQSWYASIQREVLRNVIVDLAYVGNKADGLLLFANYNQATPNNAAGTLSLQSRRPIPQFADITYAFNGGKSEYKALQMKVEWRAGRALTLLSSLTLSESKDNGAGSLENSNGNAPAPQNFYNMDADWGLSGYHQPYNSTTSLVWDLPVGRGRRFGGSWSPVVDVLFGGWQVAAVNSVYAGDPVTFTYTPSAAAQVSGIQQDFRGANIYRPNVNGNPMAPESSRSITNWFNRDAVVIPTDLSQPFGNAARNSVRGPRVWQVDMVFSKRVAMPWQNSHVELRLEVFNLTNRVNFRAPNGNRSAAGFGTITSTYDPRQLQLGAKFVF
jgi:hypothetical protein